MEVLTISLNFATINKIGGKMLGIRTKRKPIGGDIAVDIRNAVRRVSTGNLSDKEKAMAKRSKEMSSRYDVHWIGLDGKEI